MFGFIVGNESSVKCPFESTSILFFGELLQRCDRLAQAATAFILKVSLDLPRMHDRVVPLRTSTAFVRGMILDISLRGTNFSIKKKDY